MPEINEYDDLIDSRDIITRIEELKTEWSDTVSEDSEDWEDVNAYELSEDDWARGLGAEGAAEAVSLVELVREGENYSPAWDLGETLIRDSYFEEYARELAYEIGYVSNDSPMANYIDWNAWADAVQLDYTEVEFNGVTFWVR